MSCLEESNILYTFIFNILNFNLHFSYMLKIKWQFFFNGITKNILGNITTSISGHLTQCFIVTKNMCQYRPKYVFFIDILFIKTLRWDQLN